MFFGNNLNKVSFCLCWWNICSDLMKSGLLFVVVWWFSLYRFVVSSGVSRKKLEMVMLNKWGWVMFVRSNIFLVSLNKMLYVRFGVGLVWMLC